VVEKLKHPGANVDAFINTRHIDVLAAVLKKAAEEQKVALTVGLLPAEGGNPSTTTGSLTSARHPRRPSRI